MKNEVYIDVKREGNRSIIDKITVCDSEDRYDLISFTEDDCMFRFLEYVKHNDLNIDKMHVTTDENYENAEFQYSINDDSAKDVFNLDILESEN